MKTQINGIEITPQMAAMLKSWYQSPGESQPECYVRWISKIQDYLMRVWVDKDDDDDDIPQLKECVSALMVIKDDLSNFIPGKEGGEV